MLYASRPYKPAPPSLCRVLALTIISALLLLLTPPWAIAKELSKVKQAGAFLKWENALSLSEDLMKTGKKAYIMEKVIKGKTYFAVLEGYSTVGTDKPGQSSQKPATIDSQGYKQAGAFLNRQNAENMIISLRQHGAVTFHCMKKEEDKVYYKVYKKTGVVVSSPCTKIIAEHTEPPAATIQDQTTPTTTAPMAGDAASETPVDELTGAQETQAPEQIESVTPSQQQPDGQDMTQQDNGATSEATGAAGTAGTAAGEAAPGAVAITDGISTDVSSGMDLQEDQEETSAGQEVAISEDTTQEQDMDGGKPGDQTPPNAAPSNFIPDSSAIRDIDDDVHFYIKPDAMVYKDRNQFGQVHGRFRDFGGGTVSGQSNKWYIIKLQGGIEGYIQKVDTMEYTIDDDEDHVHDK